MAVQTLTAHGAVCGGSCFIEGETRSGLSAFSAVCTTCRRHYSIQSSHQATGSDGKKRWSVNVTAVLSQMASGGGLARLNSTPSLHAGMQKRMYAKTEEFLGEAMKTQLIEAMAQAGREEKQNAIDKGHYHQGVSAISPVVADGGWSKRSHKHSYNAKSSVALI